MNETMLKFARSIGLPIDRTTFTDALHECSFVEFGDEEDIKLYTSIEERLWEMKFNPTYGKSSIISNTGGCHEAVYEKVLPGNQYKAVAKLKSKYVSSGKHLIEVVLHIAEV